MDQPTTVYILAIHDEETWSWSPLSATPTWFLNGYAVQGQPSGAERPVFSAVARGGRCLVTWSSPSVPAPFPVAAPQTELAPGARFDLPGRTYVVWAGPASWSDPDAGADPQVMNDLGALTSTELDSAARRFLTLPYVSVWWHDEFVRRTGFIQCRDGRVPRIAHCEVVRADGGYELRCSVEIWDLFQRARTSAPPARLLPGAEAPAPYARPLRGADLVALRNCAALLPPLPASDDQPALDDWPDSLQGMSVPELQEKLASLQAHAEDPESQDRMRLLRKVLRHRREIGRDQT